jgi:hypothetical protein
MPATPQQLLERDQFNRERPVLAADLLELALQFRDPSVGSGIPVVERLPLTNSIRHPVPAMMIYVRKATLASVITRLCKDCRWAALEENEGGIVWRCAHQRSNWYRRPIMSRANL